jgi:hypothetical protein
MTTKPGIRIIKRSEKAASEAPRETSVKKAKTPGDSAREAAATVASWVREFKEKRVVRGRLPVAKLT